MLSSARNRAATSIRMKPSPSVPPIQGGVLQGEVKDVLLPT